MIYIIDTNVFLEILLRQEKLEQSKEFLDNNSGKYTITDFSLHSIGIILFRNKKEDFFKEFINDVIRFTGIVTLPFECMKM